MEMPYTQCEPWLEELLLLLDQNKQILQNFMKVHFPEISVFELEGTYLQWMDFRGLGLEYHQLEVFLQEKAWLFFDEGSLFGKAGEGFERMNIACPTRALREALERLDTAWKQFKNK